ncbi:GGDEF domain-containing protein [Sphingobium phenoxybenzoativorans]|uniref:GGDEF domain-containing protein n=1 Tax=Sphingobium phenoxybenzoativorans TaxID=1592790 RepID=UPI000871E4D0|nr:GGDEF domain-containing protein [Sphingobium phenoxybenzoativorans]
MNPHVVILSVLFFTSSIMCVAMTLAWLSFGRDRHVLYWAMSYGIAVLQWLFNGAGLLLDSHVLMTLAGLCILASSSLVAIGARQRSGLPVGWGQFIIGWVVAGAGVAVAFSPMGTMAMRGSIASSFTGVMMIAAAAAIWPRRRIATPPERAFIVMLVIFGVFQIALVSAGLMIGQGGSDAGLTLYRAILGLGLPPIYVATGVAAVLVVAGDLAKQLGSMVSNDQLTGILNRRGVEQAAIMAIANAKRQKRKLAAVICDMDSFKTLNDGYGHIAGDAALRTFAKALLLAVRKGDVVGRLGGDEFCVLLIDSSGDAAVEVMERVRGSLSNLSVAKMPPGCVKASFGVAEFMPGDNALEDLIARADEALYQSKQQGRDRVTLWSKAAA